MEMQNNCEDNEFNWNSDVPSVLTEICNVAEVTEEAVNYVWKINKWSSICRDSCRTFQSLRSPHVVVTTGGHYQSTWFVELRNNDGCLSLFLCECLPSERLNGYKNSIMKGLLNPHHQPVKCNFKIVGVDNGSVLASDGSPPSFDPKDLQLLDGDQNILSDQISTAVVIDVFEQSQWLNFINLRDMFEDQGRYLCNDAIVFQINFKIPYFHMCCDSKSLVDVFGKTCQDALDKSISVSKASLATDISRMFLSEESADFTVECGGLSFPVHKHVILCRSRELYKELMKRIAGNFTKLREHTDPILTNSAIISDLNPTTLKSVIEFIYKGYFSSSKDFNDLRFILEAASYYDLQGLKEACFVEIIDILDLESEDSVAELMDIYAADDHIKFSMHEVCQAYQEDIPKETNCF